MSQKMVYVPKNIHFLDLYLHNFGEEKCTPYHSYGPAIREYHLIHYVLEGKGMYKIDNQLFEISAGQGFLIPPDVVSFYQADAEYPWQYCWVGFHGLQAKHFIKQTSLTRNEPIFQDKDASFANRITQMLTADSVLRQTALLYLLLDDLTKSNPRQVHSELTISKQEIYVKMVIDFIDMHFSDKLTVFQIARFVGLDRSYLTSLFKTYIGLSIQEYLVNYRISKACLLLKNSDHAIGDISRSVGYHDSLLFSKLFRKKMGISPKNYRMEQKHNRGEEEEVL
ncbi:AraC family transcriptional regulator [Alkalihalobacillus sp. NPDC078783]